ncbi:hypothetical protein I4F81_006781 [Pyropia yezoensis]|uniref:Uncharacterized protein n=1 Tax=Pyropia yezoensis TaxID=2788 RepID=A0ACC3C388_PYRYE|nr:hypothetical protein I4F81_006781 [Neopyropia yezoensis]
MATNGAAPPMIVTVTGAAGQIAYSLLPAICAGRMFGPTTRVALRLLEIPPAMTSLGGVVMELTDCAWPLLASVTATSDAAEAFAGTNVAVLVGAFPRGPGMERAELLAKNAGIFRAQGAALDAGAAPGCKVVVYPDVTRAKVAGKPEVDVVATMGGQQALAETFIPTIQKRGAAIIAARKMSSAMSAAKAICDHVATWLGGSDGATVSMAVAGSGEYGVEAGTFFSYPVTCEGGEWTIVEGLAIDEASRKYIDATSQELQAERTDALAVLAAATGGKL